MTIKETIPLGHPKLKAKNKRIKDFNSKRLQKLIRDLTDTMRKLDLIGMAAPQIGENYQVFVTEPRKTKARKNVIDDKLRVFVNPKIVERSKAEHVIWEGCGCTGDIFGPVKRARIVTIEALDQNGEKFQITANGILGRVILHEIDHLNGIEFLERVKDNRKLVRMDYYVKNIRNTKTNVDNSKVTILEFKKL